MSDREKHHIIVEHIWRALRAFLLMMALLVWIAQDGMQSTDYIVISLVFIAHLAEQFHGFICNRIQRVVGWIEDFNDYD